MIRKEFIMIITTTHTIEDRKIKNYCGIVSASIIAVLPGGNRASQRAWSKDVDDVCSILEAQAAEKGANAIVGVSMQLFGTNLCATGTAVEI